MQIINEIIDKISNKNWKIKIIPIHYLNHLKNSLKETYKIINNKEFVDFIRNCFNFNINTLFNLGKSIIIVAIPSPQILLTIRWNNSQRKLTIPPTYIDMRSGINKAEKVLSLILNKNGYNIKRVELPEKLLAVHSGLAEYGKNNICYVEGMGSFCRLVSFVTDIETIDCIWHDLNIMKYCKNCNVCTKRCPTGAIRKDRFLIDGDKCLTYFNERPGRFPEWINASSHHCLVGCLFCQDKCPQNKKFQNNYREYEFFDEKEVKSIMNKRAFEHLDSNIKIKLIKLNMDVYYNVLSRNLKVLL